MPLFWLPWTVEVYEFNKQYLLFFLVSLALLAWLTKMIVCRKRFVWRRTPLDIPILIFMVVMILASVFSVDSISSWLGFYGRFSDAVVGLLAMCLMYFVVVQNSKYNPKPKTTQLLTIKGMLNWFLVSATLVVIAAYFSILGLWSKMPWLGEQWPNLMNLRTFNPVTGSLEGLSIFLVAVMSLLVGLILNYSLMGKIQKPFYFLLLLASIILLVLIDFWAAWVVLGVTMLFLLIVAFWTRMFRERVNLLTLPIILVIISMAGLTMDFERLMVSAYSVDPGQIPAWAQLPKEIILDYQTAGTVTWQAIKEYPVLGSGPGTFFHDFAKFKPAEFNQNRFWNIRFDKGPSHLMEMVSTSGILGILSYLAIVVIFLLVMVVFLKRCSRIAPSEDFQELSSRSRTVPESFPQGQSLSQWPFLLLLLLPWLALFIAQFVYLQNTTLAFSFWLFTALSIVQWRQGLETPWPKKSFSFEKLPEVGLVMSTLLLILVFVALGLFYLGGRFYVSDIRYRQGMNQVSDVREQVSVYEKAVNLNKYRANYRIGLSKAYLISAWIEARKPAEEQNVQLLQAYAVGAIQQARQATIISPQIVTSWENLGTVYRDLRGLVGGTLSFAADTFRQALEMEPTNPLFYRELCRINLIKGEEEDWEKTLGYCQKAVDLKPNYLDAHIQLALVYEKKGDLEEAIKRLEGALDKLKGVSFQRGSVLAGAATEIYFQMGRLHFNVNHIDRAIELFQQAIIITPQHSNARYALGIAYQMKGMKNQALEQFQIINQLNPGNKEVEAKIRELSQ
jgi:tetratricopeptide (TPR) repeat protein